VTHATVKPVRLRAHDDDLRVDTSRIIGYRATWPSGEKGPVRATYRAASLDIRQAVKAPA
jgi:hypothetical protein